MVLKTLFLLLVSYFYDYHRIFLLTFLSFHIYYTNLLNDLLLNKNILLYLICVLSLNLALFLILYTTTYFGLLDCGFLYMLFLSLLFVLRYIFVAVFL